jgi:hypothetical protein
MAALVQRPQQFRAENLDASDERIKRLAPEKDSQITHAP